MSEEGEADLDALIAKLDEGEDDEDIEEMNEGMNEH